MTFCCSSRKEIGKEFVFPQNRLILISMIFLALVPSLLSCVSGGSDSSSDQVKLSKEEQKKLSEYKAEVKIGRDMAGRLLQFYGVYGDESLIGYVNQVGNYVASYGDHPERKYMFGILDSESVNAFACPGGYILVTLGAIRHAKTEAELAMILGHEAAHVGLQHMFNTLKAMGEREAEKVSEKNNANSKKLKESSVDRIRKRPEPESVAGAELLTRYLSQSGGVGLSLLKAAQAGMNVLLEKGLDKKLEYEADAAGVEYAIRAGYDPNALLKFLKRLQKKNEKNSSKAKHLEKTHPKISDRRSRIKKQLKEMEATRIIGANGKSRYQKYLINLPELE